MFLIGILKLFILCLFFHLSKGQPNGQSLIVFRSVFKKKVNFLFIFCSFCFVLHLACADNHSQCFDRCLGHLQLPDRGFLHFNQCTRLGDINSLHSAKFCEHWLCWLSSILFTNLFYSTNVFKACFFFFLYSKWNWLLIFLGVAK